MRFETAVTTAAEMAAMFPTEIDKFMLVAFMLVLLKMVDQAWRAMLATTLAPRRRRKKTRPPAQKKK